MVLGMIYLVIGFCLGLRSISNSDPKYLDDWRYFAGQIVGSLIWPISAIIGIIVIISEKIRKA
jgi:hypothetical protein